MTNCRVPRHKDWQTQCLKCLAQIECHLRAQGLRDATSIDLLDRLEGIIVGRLPFRGNSANRDDDDPSRESAK